MNKDLSIGVVKPQSAAGFMSIKYMRFPSIGALSIASFLKKKGYTVNFIDLDFDAYDPSDYDIVLISMSTPEATEGYKLADRCRELGVPVIGGGCHVTLNVNEAKKHFDIIVKGDGIPLILKAIDKARKRKKGILRGNICSKERLNLIIDNSLLDRNKYSGFNFIITSIGCPRSCSFCCVWKLYGKRIFWKDDATIEKEIRNFRKNRPVFILDDDLNFVKPSTFKLMKKYGYKFVGEASLDFIKNNNFKLSVDCGLTGIALAFESINEETLKNLNKNQSIHEYDKIIKTVKDNKLSLFGLFILDPDTQTKKDMEQLIEYTINKNFDFAQFAIMTPFPGTDIRRQINRRIFDNNWKNYTGSTCVFNPKKMNYKEVNKLIKYAYKKFYSTKSILKRMMHTKRLVYFLLGNLAVWLALKKEWR